MKEEAKAKDVEYKWSYDNIFNAPENDLVIGRSNKGQFNERLFGDERNG